MDLISVLNSLSVLNARHWQSTVTCREHHTYHSGDGKTVEKQQDRGLGWEGHLSARTVPDTRICCGND